MDATRKKTVLHVDDAPLWREYVKKLLGDEYEVMSCGDCQSALAKIRRGGVDLVILDHLLPGKGPFDLGFDFCVHLKKMHPELPVIIYTGAWWGVERTDRDSLQRRTGAAVVFKDVRHPELDDLHARVNAHLAEPPESTQS